MTASLLAGVSVIELGGDRGAAAAALLADLGAKVIKVGAMADPAYDFGKRRIGEQDSALAGLIRDADIVISSSRADFAPDGRIAIAGRSERGRVLLALTAFGLTGPMSDFAGPEIVVSALGGALGVTGQEDRPPVKEALEACGFHAEMMAAAGAAFALFDLRAGAEAAPGDLHVDISVQEVVASRMTSGLLAWQFDRRSLERTGTAISYGKARIRCVWDLKDGWVFHSLMTGRFGAPANAALSAWMDEAGADNPLRGVNWETYDRSAIDASTRARWEGAIDAFFRTLTKDDMHTQGRRRGINACVVNLPSDVLADRHLAAREFWREGDIRMPARFLRVVEAAETPIASPTPARASAARTGALAGVRVLDFSWALVGSITTKLLADQGAVVVKVESATRPCLSRLDVQVAASKRGNFDDKPWFIHMNTSKSSLRLNMKRPEAREVIDPLVAWADVVVENFSPGTMAALGLDYAALSKRRPDLVMVSGSVFGQTGPLSREWGVDGTGAALSGRLALTGWPDRTPVTPSAVPYGDVLLPPMMVAAAAAALFRRAKTGRGAHIDASMYEACVQQMAPGLVAKQRGAAAERVGNADPQAQWQAVLPARDRFLAVRVADSADQERLRALTGGDGGEAVTAAWLLERDPWDAMARLQAAGIAAGVVQTAEDLIERDAQLRGRGFLVDLDNPVLGRFEHQACAIRIAERPGAMRTAPALGEHTRDICLKLAGLSQDRFEVLRAAGLFE